MVPEEIKGKADDSFPFYTIYRLHTFPAAG